MKRAFDKDILKELVWGDGPPEYELVDTIDVDTSRWSSHHTMIFRFEGKLWGSDYSQGLTESQDQSPYEYDEPEAYEVEAVEKTIIAYVPVKEPAQ